MRAWVLSLSAFAAIMGGFSASGVARADGSDLLRMMPSNVLYRALVGESSRDDFSPAEFNEEDRPEAEVAAMPPLPELPELPEQPEALPEDEMPSEEIGEMDWPMPAEVDSVEEEPVEEESEFKYDDDILVLGTEVLPLAELPMEVPAEIEEMIEAASNEEPLVEEPMVEEPMVEQPAPEQPEPVIPLPSLPLPPDPFFGSISTMLGAKGDQPWIPSEAIRPPVPARFFDGKWVNLDPWGKPTKAIDELATVSSGEPLNFNTSGAGDTAGKAVLLVDGRAMLVKSIEWTDSRVNLDIPQLTLAKPTIARVYIADANGTVQDFADFLLE